MPDTYPSSKPYFLFFFSLQIVIENGFWPPNSQDRLQVSIAEGLETDWDGLISSTSLCHRGAQTVGVVYGEPCVQTYFSCMPQRVQSSCEKVSLAILIQLSTLSSDPSFIVPTLPKYGRATISSNILVLPDLGLAFFPGCLRIFDWCSVYFYILFWG